jgi:predicted restriction endonuclease
MPPVSDEERAKNRAYYLANKERILTRMRAALTSEEGRAKKQAADRKQYQKNKEIKKEQSRQYFAAHREEQNQKRRERRRNNRVKEQATVTRWCQEHPEAVHIIKERWRRGNLEHILAKQRERYAQDLEKSRQLARQRRKKAYASNPERFREYSKGQYARRRGAPVNDLTAAQWKEIKEQYDHRCVYCGRKMQRLTQDHITPVTKHGPHTLHNIVPCCLSCNAKKRTGPPLKPVQPLLLTIAAPRKKKTKP